ncbi:ectoine synthase [Flexivirga meconopsidis]|uniref:ectoine synthase n=1 Tax=Flexivirga meconopsidis TaxID=2977121 RepID=UPI002240CCD2|nr:ectoine synthase [Flexivirga meconopsidis]
MLIRQKVDSPRVAWGNGDSYRMVVENDGLGFALAHTVVTKGTVSRLQYRNHIEACYCISGSGAVVEADGTRHEITPGVLYALNNHDPHELVADNESDLVLLSVFNPPIVGNEQHVLDDAGYSCY